MMNGTYRLDGKTRNSYRILVGKFLQGQVRNGKLVLILTLKVEVNG